MSDDLTSPSHAPANDGETIGSDLTLPPQATTLPALNLAAAGSHIGRYRILDRIGEGGMGVVYLAEQEHPVRRRVALKIIKPGMDTAMVVARFEAERQALALMDHPCIARVFDGGSTDSGRPYFVMELVKGLTLTQYCDQKKLTLPERLELFRTVCAAVQHAHQKGIIHRDLKPGNILVSVGDEGAPVVKVIDFGIAKAIGQSLTDHTVFTEQRQLIGTPHYMSPEQADNQAQDIDTRSDIYSLGVILYELLTGTTPLDPKQLRQLTTDRMQQAIREQEPPKPSTRVSTLGDRANIVAEARQSRLSDLSRTLRGDLDWIVMKAIEKDRNRRYETANAFSRDVQRYLVGEAVEACPPSTTYRLKKFALRNRVWLATAGAFAAVLVIASVVSIWQAIEANRARADAVDALRQKGQALEEKERQRTAADAARIRADREAKVARSVQDFLQDDLLMLANPHAQADQLLELGLSERFKVQRDPPVTELLERAAAGVEGNRLEERFPKEPKVQAEVLYAMALGYYGVGRLDRAVTLLSRAHVILEDTTPVEDSLAIDITTKLASFLSEAGNYDEAIRLAELVLKRVEPASQSRAVEYLGAKNCLGVIHCRAGRYAEALSLLEQTAVDYEKQLGENNQWTLACWSNLATARHLSGRIASAAPLFERCYTVRLKTQGPDHPSTIHAMQNLASIYVELGRTGESVQLLTKALELRRGQYGNSHLETLMAMNNLGMALKSDKQSADAILQLEGAVAGLVELVGAEHLLTLQGKVNLGNAYRDTGKLELAVPLLEESAAGFRKQLGLQKSQTIRAISSLAMAYAAGGGVEKAISMLEEIVPVAHEKLGRRSTAFIQAATSLGALYHRTRQQAKGLGWLEEVVAGTAENYGPDAQPTLNAVQVLAVASYDAGRLDLAETAFRRLVDAYRPTPYPKQADALASLLLVMDRQKHFAESEPFVRELLAILERRQPDAWSTFGHRYRLGASLNAQKRYAEAEPELKRAYEGLRQRREKIPSQQLELINVAGRLLVSVYQKLDRAAEANAVLEELQASK